MGEWGQWDALHRHDDAAWRSLATGVGGVPRGYASNKRDERGYPVFVAATALSDASLRTHGEEPMKELPRLPASPPSPNDAEAGEVETGPESAHGVEESMASLYHRLVASSTAAQRPSRDEADHGDDLPSLPRIRLPTAPRRTGSDQDWFIRRAIRHQARKDAESEEAIQESAAPCMPLQCSLCHAVVRSGSNPTLMAAHQASIAHQLALGSTDAAPVMTGSSRSRRQVSEAVQACKRSSLVLKSSNIGYMALERMGWRAGMGLGIDEWEVARVEALGRRRKASTQSIATIDTTDENGGDGGVIDLTEQDVAYGGEESIADSTREGASDATATLESAAAKRRADVQLEPVPLHVRPDRRGIGVKLPASARVRDRPVVTTTPSTQQQHKREHHRPKKLSRTAKHNRDRAEWLTLRASLNE